MKRSEIAAGIGEDALPCGDWIDPSYAARNNASSRNHLLIKRIDRFDDFAVNRFANLGEPGAPVEGDSQWRPFWNRQRDLNWECGGCLDLRSRRRAKRWQRVFAWNFWTAGILGLLRNGREDPCEELQRNNAEKQAVHRNTPPSIWGRRQRVGGECEAPASGSKR